MFKAKVMIHFFLEVCNHNAFDAKAPNTSHLGQAVSGHNGTITFIKLQLNICKYNIFISNDSLEN